MSIFHTKVINAVAFNQVNTYMLTLQNLVIEYVWIVNTFVSNKICWKNKDKLYNEGKHWSEQETSS